MTEDDVIEMARYVGYPLVEYESKPYVSPMLVILLETAFEKGRLQGMAQERALWELSKITQELGPIETYIEKKAKGEA